MSRGLTVLALLTVLLGPMPAGAATDVWRALAEGGHVALMRHARAPGTGDPENFRLGDCSTQRSLDNAGRARGERVRCREGMASSMSASIPASGAAAAKPPSFWDPVLCKRCRY